MADAGDMVIRALDEKIAELSARIRRDSADLQAIERAKGVILRGTQPADQLSLPGVSPYAGLRPQAAVERFLQENPGTKFKAGEIAKRLIKLGIEKRGTNFTSTVIGALNRATKKGIALQARGATGRNVYTLKAGEAT